MPARPLAWIIFCFAVCIALGGCSPAPASATQAPISLAQPAVSAPETLSPTPQAVSSPASAASPGAPVSISGVTWSAAEHVVQIQLDGWPAAWPGWSLLVDGAEFPMEGEAGETVARPNAPLEQPPTGLLVGALPWVSGLDETNFPCCGELQLSIPGQGLTERYAYNLVDFGCATASPKVCPAEWTVHEGDLIVAGTETRQIKDTKFLQKGNIYVRDSATLEISHAELMMVRGATPTIHVYIFVDPGATLIVDHARIYPPDGDGLVCVMNRGETRLIDSPTSIHYFDMSAGARLSMQNSELIYTIGGLLQVAGGSTQVSDSTIGALGLAVPAGAHLEIDGLKPGVTFDHWDVRDLIPEAGYDLTLENTTLLPDDFTGELEHGPYERGWIFFLDRNAHVRLSNSELRKVFLDVRSDTVTFRDLQIGQPSSLNYRDIQLTDVVVQGEWPFTITDADVTLVHSTYLFLQPQGNSTVRLVDSHVVELIPREFTGTLIFENGLWTVAGEILGGVDYHSLSNDFAIRGSLKIGPELRTNLQWKDARVTREFEVLVSDPQGNPLGGVTLRLDGQEAQTGADGRAVFNYVFDENNYNQPTPLEAWFSGQRVSTLPLDFFAETPVRLTVGE